MEKDNQKTESRRKFIKTAGKFAVFTPPTLMVMSKSNAWIVETNGNCDTVVNNCDH